MTTFLRGTEVLTLEVGLSLDAAEARARVPSRFAIDTDDGRAHGSLLLFKMRGLALAVLPVATLDYAEALWRISIRHEDAPAWFAHACDLDRWLVRALGAWVVRYPTRAAAIDGSDERWRIAGSGARLELRLADAGERAPPPPPPLRRTFVAHGARVFEIPWDERAPAQAQRVRVTATETSLLGRTLGASAALETRGTALRGRVHMCGWARPV